MTTDRPVPPQQRPRRPLLMDPAGAALSDFAPPAPHQPAQPPVDPPRTPSVLAAPAPAPAPAARGSADSAFGPVSEVVRLSVRSTTARVDVVLPDRCTIAETLEAVLELSPPALRELAVAHGGWTLRGGDGRVLPSGATLVDLGVTDGSTLLLLGLDTARIAPVYDDVAEAVADTVAGDAAAWPDRAGRAVALAAAGLFAAVGVAVLLLAGPPWGAVALTLAGVTVAAQAAAGLLARRARDDGAALALGLISIATGTAAAAVATAGPAPLIGLGAPQVLAGAAGAVLCSITAVVIVGVGRVPLIAVGVGAAVVAVGAASAVLFDLPAAGAAAIVAGLCLVLLPAAPFAAMRVARLGIDIGFVPAGSRPAPADDAGPVAADGDGLVDVAAVAARTRTAAGYLTAMVHALSWPALLAAVALAFVGDVTAQVLAGVTAAALLLRARLFGTIGQRLPLLIAGLGSAVALLVGVALDLTGTAVLWVAAATALGVLAALAIATRRAAVSPATRRAGEILDVLLAVAAVPLVAATLGLFGFIRGLGG